MFVSSVYDFCYLFLSPGMRWRRRMQRGEWEGLRVVSGNGVYKDNDLVYEDGD